jgi:hypothetical protein
VLEDAPFRAAYLAWGGAAADVEVVGGFVDRRQNPPAVVLHKGRVKTVTVLHEALHIYSDDALRTDAGILASVVGSNYVNEGFTQYFTEQIADEQYLSIEGIGDDYRAAAREVAALTDVPGVSEEMLRRAYFEGDVAGLRAAVDAAHGADTFDNWAAAINARNWDGARRIARGR